MDYRTRARARIGFAVLAAFAAVTATAQGTAPPISSFFNDYAYESVLISPGGRYLAVTFTSSGASNAAVLDTQDMKVRPLTGFRYPDELNHVYWKSDDALVYEMTQMDGEGNRLRNIASLRRDGTNHVYLLDNERPENTFGMWYFLRDEILDLLPDDPDTVLLVSEAERQDFASVYRVGTKLRGNLTRTRMMGNRFATSRHAIGPPPGRKCSYLADHRSAVRICLTREVDGSSRMLYRPGTQGEWRELEHFTEDSSRMFPVGFTDDDQALIVLSNVKRGNDALYIYEPEKKALAELVFEAPKGLDVTDAVFSTYGARLVAARYNDGGGKVVFFDAPMARAHRAVQNLFPDARISVTSMTRDGRKAVVLVTSGSEPGTFYLVDDEKQRVAELVRRAPWLKDARFGLTRAIEYQARDQTLIAGFVTYPAGREPRNLPMIVNPHGGPFGVQDTGSYDREAQFFASRGYAVLQVNFRGSGGFGTAFRTAGYREWGKKMQDDITDGVLWAIKEGIADKNRIGIYGASYGGYAAMMGLVRSPELFRCGITFAGVSDLDMLLNTTAIRGSTSKVYVEISKEDRLIWEEMLGDRKDEASLRAVSPRYNVAAIRAPVLIAHGEDDFTVPFAHATALRDELLRAGKPVDFLGVREEGHGFREAANRVLLFERIEKFLVQHLPADAPAAAP